MTYPRKGLIKYNRNVIIYFNPKERERLEREREIREREREIGLCEREKERGKAD